MANVTPAPGNTPQGHTTTCNHANRITRVTGAAAGCETTGEYCADCGQLLTNPQMDCR